MIKKIKVSLVTSNVYFPYTHFLVYKNYIKKDFKSQYQRKSNIMLLQSVDKLPILKKIDFLINQSGLNCLKRANIGYLIPKKCSFLYFSVRNIKGCDKADLKNRLCQQPDYSLIVMSSFYLNLSLK